jgi:hypothetical protein
MLSPAGASVFTGYRLIQKVHLKCFETETLCGRFIAGMLQGPTVLGMSSTYTAFAYTSSFKQGISGTSDKGYTIRLN